jgi:hypothetical protein
MRRNILGEPAFRSGGNTVRAGSRRTTKALRSTNPNHFSCIVHVDCDWNQKRRGGNRSCAAVASRHIVLATQPTEGAQAAKRGCHAAAAATTAPAPQALAGETAWIGATLVVAVAMVAVIVLLRRERAA